MILLFLGSWRSTIIIAVSIPLSILTSVIVLSLIGQTINIMTLGGLALAVGILVDDATVTIENIERYLEDGHVCTMPSSKAQRRSPCPHWSRPSASASSSCRCSSSAVSPAILFVPLAEAVVFAMLASYILSRTLVPTLAMYLLKRHDHNAVPLEQYLRPLPARIRARLRAGAHRLCGMLRRARALAE